MVIRVTFCDLIGGFILNDFGVRSSVKHFFKKINWFFDTAALAFLLLEFRTMKLNHSKTRDLFDYLFWLSYESYFQNSEHKAIAEALTLNLTPKTYSRFVDNTHARLRSKDLSKISNFKRF